MADDGPGIPEALMQSMLRSIISEHTAAFIICLGFFFEIVTSATYEILNLFDLDITPEEAAHFPYSDERVKLLASLYEKSQDLSPRPATITYINPSPSRSGEEHKYKYPSKLESTNIRILSMQPNVEKNHPIECKLYVRDLNENSIEAALSYVWGDWPPEQMIPKESIVQRGHILAPIPKGFGGNSISQYDLPAMLNELLTYQKHEVWDEKQTHDLRNILDFQVSRRDANRWDNLFVRQLRPEKRNDVNMSNLQDRSEGRLINVDYNESDNAVYKRITARCLNPGIKSNIFRYNLLIEHQGSLRDTQLGPSWVLDFTYSDSERQTSKLVQRTLYGLLLLRTSSQPLWDWDNNSVGVVEPVFFATPKTLFCSGISVSVIYHTKPVPGLTRDNYKSYESFLGDFIKEARQEWDRIVTADKLLERQTQGTTSDNNSEAEKTAEIESSIQMPTREELVDLATFRSNLIRFFEKVSETYLFAVKDGMIGLATAPGQKGDILAIIHMHPNYIVLREVEHEIEKKHRIVARAALTETREKMRDRIKEGLQQSLFQII
ncbi:hypothetical protein CIB48_g3846 [Xylaria polymorpha]|nr:hypothetical protein CIB48_g3846 [Xylaria polymorpha]